MRKGGAIEADADANAMQLFLTTLGESGLLTPELLAATRQRAAGLSSPIALGAELVDAGHLTHWQFQRLLAGKRRFFVADYRMLDRLGAGATGEVYKVMHSRMKRLAAMKILAPAFVANAEAVERFRREFRAVASLQHPNIVEVHGGDTIGDQLYLVMEFIDGETLNAWMKRQGRLDVRFACQCAQQIALGLQHAHDRGIFHRDVKPANVMIAFPTLGGPPHAKILDFGLARFLNEAGDQRLTTSNEVIGTPAYMAPEHAMNTKRADARSDVYSLGCVLFELLTGEIPLRAENLVRTMLLRMQKPAPKVRELRPDAPAPLEAVIARMLDRDAPNRFQRAGDVAQAIAPFTK